MRPAWLLPVLALPLLAGCLGNAQPETLSAATLPAGPLLGAASGLPLLPRAGNLDAPPQWALGEWWTYRVESLAYGFSFEVTTVVAGAAPGAYLLGMPRDAFAGEALIFHFPGLGEVDRATLGFDAHDLFFQPLQFPLREGAAWNTQWYSGAPMEAKVTRVAGTTAEVVLEHPARRTTLTYDAASGTIARMDIQDYLELELVAHGHGFRGDVVVPASQDLVVCHGRAAAAQAIDGCGLDAAPRAPVERVRVMGPYDALTFALILSGGPGAYELRVTAPDGAAFGVARGPAEGPVFRVFTHDAPLGAWDVRAVAGGPGTALFEGPAYRALAVTLS